MKKVYCILAACQRCCVAFAPAVLIAAALLSGCGGGMSPRIGVGDRAPASNNLVVGDEADWRKVSTMDTRVPLYRWRIADLLEQRKPFLVVFGTPQHCTMCVDQIVRVAVMQETYGDRFAFIHVDGYKDNDVWVEWGVRGEPWTFIVDATGTVTGVFPGQTEFAVLDRAIKAVLHETG